MGSGYGVIYRDVLQSDVSIYAKALYCLLCTYCGKEKSCFPSQRTISRDLNMHRNTIIKAVQELEDNKILSVDRSAKTNKYYLIGTPDVPVKNKIGTRDVPVGTPDVPIIGTPGSTLRITYKNNIEKEKIEFYRDEIEISNNNPGYISIVEFLLIDEQTGEPLNGILRMNGQIGYEDWLVLERKIGIMEQKGYNDTLKNKILSLVNNKKYNGKYDNLFKTMNTWINGDAQKIGVKLPENERFRKVIRDEEKARKHDQKTEIPVEST